MQKFYNNEKFSDFNIKIDNQIIKSHKVILCQLDYFNTLFNNEFKDSKYNLELNDISYKNACIFIKVLYGIYEKIDSVGDGITFLYQTRKFMAFHLFKPLLKCLTNIDKNDEISVDVMELETIFSYFIINKIEFPLPFNNLFINYCHEFNLELISIYLEYYTDIDDDDTFIKIIVNVIEHNNKLTNPVINHFLTYLPKKSSTLKILLEYNIKNSLLIDFIFKLFRLNLSNELSPIINQNSSKKCNFPNCKSMSSIIKYGSNYCEKHLVLLEKHSDLFCICNICNKYINTIYLIKTNTFICKYCHNQKIIESNDSINIISPEQNKNKKKFPKIKFDETFESEDDAKRNI